jgi:hypothetical protein
MKHFQFKKRLYRQTTELLMKTKMFSKILFRYVFLTILFNNFGEKNFAQNPIWTVGTAITIPQNETEISLFRPARYGLTRRLELDAHPLDFFLMPQLFAKYMWAVKTVFHQKFLISSRHGIYYPTFQLRAAQKYGPSNLFPESVHFSPVLAFQNEILISHYLTEPSHCNAGNNLLTLRLGFKYSFTSGQPERPIIQRPILFRETMVFYPKPVWYAGLDIDAALTEQFNYFADLDYYSVGLHWNYWSAEGKTGIMGYSGKNLSACIGVKFAYSKLPGISKFYIIPIADISYTFRLKKNKKKQTGLFNRKEGFKYESFDLKGDIQYYQPKPDTTKIDFYLPDGK